LNRGLFIRREDGRVLRWIHIQSDHVGRFGLKVGIIGLHVPLDPMRLQPSRLPRVRHVVVIDPQQRRELAGTPVGAPVRRRLTRLLKNPRLHRRCQHHRGLTVVPGLQPGEALGQKPSPPAINEVAVARDRGFDHRVRGAIGQHQDYARASRILRANLAATQTRLECRAFIMSENQRHMARQRTSTESRCTVHFVVRNRKQGQLGRYNGK
jgi:hypothetical protein